MLQNWQNVTTFDKDCLLKVFEPNIVPPSRAWHSLLILIEEEWSVRHVEINYLLLGVKQARIGPYFWRKHNGVTDHILRVKCKSLSIRREFLPHGPHDWLSSPSHLLECRVHVVNKVVALIDCGSDCSLNSLALKPWLTVRCIYLSVGSVERIESSKLVELNEKIIWDLSVESRDVWTTKGMATDSELEDHVDGSLKFVFSGSIITGPVGSEFLWAKEEASREHKRSSLIIISCQKTSPGASLVKCAISIMDVAMLKAAAISFIVSHVERHSVSVGTEYRWLIHIIPDVVEVARPWEISVTELLAPVLLSIFIEEVNVGWVTWPAVAIEVIVRGGFHKDVRQITWGLWGIL